MESLLAWLLLVWAAHSVGWLVAEALSSRWAPRILGGTLAALVVADLAYHCPWSVVLRLVAQLGGTR